MIPSRMRARTTSALVFVAAATAALAQEGAAPPAPPALNLVIVTIDTVRADHLGCYGYFRDTTPHLDALAKDCLRFTRCLAPIAHTTPSHCSLFTGVHPFEHGVLSNFFERPDEVRAALSLQTSPTLQTLAQAMRSRGRKTGGFVGSTPVKRFTGLDAGFDEWSEPDKPRRTGREVIADALQFVDSCGGAPFFLWVHLFDAHGPIAPPRFPPKEYADRYKTDPALRAWLKERGFPDAVAGEHMGEVPPSSAHNYYDGALRFLDDQFDALAQRLRAKDLWDRTVIVVVGDHGQGLGQHGFLGHGTCWDEQLRVPLLVRVPGVAPAVVDLPCSTIDVVPTVAALAPDLADEAFLRQCRGVDLLAEGREPHPIFGMAPDEHDQAALTAARWKLVRRGREAPLLFDLESDPFELRNVASDHKDVVTALVRRLDSEIARQRQSEKLHHAGMAAGAAIDPKILEELRALGYGGTGDDAPTLPAGEPPPAGGERRKESGGGA